MCVCVGWGQKDNTVGRAFDSQIKAKLGRRDSLLSLLSLGFTQVGSWACTSSSRIDPLAQSQE